MWHKMHMYIDIQTFIPIDMYPFVYICMCMFVQCLSYILHIQIHMYPHMYIAHIYVCTHVYKTVIFSWHWVTLSEVHEECKSLISSVKGFFLDSVLINLVIYGFCAVLKPVIIRKDIRRNPLHCTEDPSHRSKPTAPFCSRRGFRAWRQTVWSVGAQSGPSAANHSQCPTSATHTSQERFFICWRKNVSDWVQCPLLCHHLQDAWDVSRADSIDTGYILSTSVESRYLWTRKPATQCPLPLLPESQLCRQLNSLPSLVRLHSPHQLPIFYIPYPICFQSSCRENPSIGPSGKASAQFLSTHSYW